MNYKKRELKGGGGEKTPFVQLTARLGSRFVGKYIGFKQEVIGAFPKNPKYLHSLAVVDGDSSVQKQTDELDEKGRKICVEAEVKAGAIVAVFATKQLHGKLSQVKPGDLVEIIYNGKAKSAKGPNQFHDFTVNLLEPIDADK